MTSQLAAATACLSLLLPFARPNIEASTANLAGLGRRFEGVVIGGSALVHRPGFAIAHESAQCLGPTKGNEDRHAHERDTLFELG